MSIIAKLMDTLRLNPDEDDEDYLDDTYEDDEDDDFDDRRYSRRSSSSDYEEDEPQGKSRLFSRSTPKVVQMKQPRQMQVSLLKPTSMEDSREIVDHLLDGRSVVLNLEGIHAETAQRIIDFASGATYSIDGNLQKISGGIFIVTPGSVGLSGEFQSTQLSDADIGMASIPGLNIRL